MACQLNTVCFAYLICIGFCQAGTARAQERSQDASSGLLPAPSNTKVSPRSLPAEPPRLEVFTPEDPQAVLPAPPLSRKPDARQAETIPAVVRPRAPHLPNPYHLGPGDMLAIIVHGIIGKFGHAPVYFPKPGQDFLPATGYPVQVHADGKLHLPSIEPVYITGLTVAEARRAVEDAYLQAGELEQRNRTMLSLLRKRTSNITMIHDRSPGGYSRVDKVALTSDQANLLGALAAGGPYDPTASVRVLKPVTSNPDTVLPDGTIVHLKSPDMQYFTTGGLIAGGRHVLPSDRPVTALQAIALAGGYRQGVIPPHRLTIIRYAAPTLHIHMRDVLRNPDAYTIHPGDQLIVR